MTVRGIRRIRGNGDQSQQNDPIASMAKGLAEAQNSAVSKQTDITYLLNQISQQLNQLNEQNQPDQQANQSMNNSQPNNNMQFSRQNNSDNSQQNQHLDPAASLQQIIGQLLQLNQQGQGQNQTSGGQEQAQEEKGKQKSPENVKTAAQALSEAQFELSVELENSLKKLRQVINDSEKLADKISKLLGEEQQNPKS